MRIEEILLSLHGQPVRVYINGASIYGVVKEIDDYGMVRICSENLREKYRVSHIRVSQILAVSTERREQP